MCPATHSSSVRCTIQESAARCANVENVLRDAHTLRTRDLSLRIETLSRTENYNLNGRRPFSRVRLSSRFHLNISFLCAIEIPRPFFRRARLVPRSRDTPPLSLRGTFSSPRRRRRRATVRYVPRGGGGGREVVLCSNRVQNSSTHARTR